MSRRLRRRAGLPVLLLSLALLCQCQAVRHDLGDYDGEVYLTPPPASVPPDRLAPFQISDTYIRLLEMFPLYSYDLGARLNEINPNKYPIYGLTLEESFEWWEIFVEISLFFFYVPDSKSVLVRGVIVVPPGGADLRTSETVSLLPRPMPATDVLKAAPPSEDAGDAAPEAPAGQGEEASGQSSD